MRFSTSIKSTVSNTSFLTNRPGGVTCGSRNVVYVITCALCGLQYVGETTQKIKSRISQHRYSISSNKLSTFLVTHFSQPDHTRESFYIDIVDYADSKAALLERELHWIKALNTAYPLGLNDSIKNFGYISEEICPLTKITQPYSTLPVQGLPKRKRNRDSRHRRKSSSQCNISIEEIVSSISNREGRALYVYGRTLCRTYLRRLIEFSTTTEFALMSLTSRYKVYSVVCREFWKGMKQKDNNSPKIMFKVAFENRCMDKLFLPSILNSSRMKNAFRSLLEPDIVIPRVDVVFKLSDSTSRMFCNYGKFLRTLDNSKRDEILGGSCNCLNSFSNFVDARLGHVCTGDTSIVSDGRLRSLFRLGAKFRMNKTIEHEAVMSELKEALNVTMNNFGKRYRRNALVCRLKADEVWQEMEPILRGRLRRSREESVTNEFDYKHSLNEIHRNFVVTIVDKASGNYAFTCKKLYLEFMEREMNTVHGNNRTYSLTDQETMEAIIRRHERATRNLNLEVTEGCALPRIYGIPKMHKNPVKFRFITGAYNSSLKAISKEFQRILRFLQTHFMRYCHMSSGHTGINNYFSITNTEKVINSLRSVNSSNTSIFCADFSSLFTNLPHDVVRENMWMLMDILFKNSGKDYVAVNNYTVKYDSGGCLKGRLYSKDDLKYILDFILKESFAVYCGKIYKQDRGIPQGNNASPQIADLTLAMMEYRYVSQKVKIQHPLSHSLGRTFRYIDDLLHVSSRADKFVEATSDMYHSSLTLERTNRDAGDTAFLDLLIRPQQDGTLNLSLYNKTDDYNFEVIRYPHRDSCIPRRIGLNTLHGEILRIYRNCSRYSEFQERVRALLVHFTRIGYTKLEISEQFMRTVSKNPNVALRYGTSKYKICVEVLRFE